MTLTLEFFIKIFRKMWFTYRNAVEMNEIFLNAFYLINFQATKLCKTITFPSAIDNMFGFTILQNGNCSFELRANGDQSPLCVRNLLVTGPRGRRCICSVTKYHLISHCALLLSIERWKFCRPLDPAGGVTIQNALW